MASRPYNLRSLGGAPAEEAAGSNQAVRLVPIADSFPTQTERGEAIWNDTTWYFLMNDVIQGWTTKEGRSWKQLVSNMAFAGFDYSLDQVKARLRNKQLPRTIPQDKAVEDFWMKERDDLASVMALLAQRRIASATQLPSATVLQNMTLSDMTELAMRSVEHTKKKKSSTNMSRALASGSRPPYFSVLPSAADIPSSPATQTQSAATVPNVPKTPVASTFNLIVGASPDPMSSQAPANANAVAAAANISPVPSHLLGNITNIGTGRLDASTFYWYGQEGRYKFLQLLILCPLQTTVQFKVVPRTEEQQYIEICFDSDLLTTVLPSLADIEQALLAKGVVAPLGTATQWHFDVKKSVRIGIPPLVDPPNLYGGPWFMDWKLNLEVGGKKYAPSLNLAIFKIQLL